MTDEELKLEIIKKRKVRNNTELLLSQHYEEFIMECMEEWAGVISKRIDESDISDEEYNEKYRL